MPDDLPPLQGIDSATLTRMNETHQQHLATFNSDDPNSPCYQRPDVARRYRDEATSNYEAILRNAGAEPPPEKTPDQLRADRFNDEWRGQAAIDEMKQSALDALQADAGLDRSQLEYRASELRRSLGPESTTPLSGTPAEPRI
jgi:hypothetical protein